MPEPIFRPKTGARKRRPPPLQPEATVVVWEMMLAAVAVVEEVEAWLLMAEEPETVPCTRALHGVHSTKRLLRRDWQRRPPPPSNEDHSFANDTHLLLAIVAVVVAVAAVVVVARQLPRVVVVPPRNIVPRLRLARPSCRRSRVDRFPAEEAFRTAKTPDNDEPPQPPLRNCTDRLVTCPSAHRVAFVVAAVVDVDGFLLETVVQFPNPRRIDRRTTWFRLTIYEKH